jgi:hypothetical protein
VAKPLIITAPYQGGFHANTTNMSGIMREVYYGGKVVNTQNICGLVM